MSTWVLIFVAGLAYNTPQDVGSAMSIKPGLPAPIAFYATESDCEDGRRLMSRAMYSKVKAGPGDNLLCLPIGKTIN